MDKQLVISALGPDQPGLVDKVTHYILKHELNIEDSRMSVLGGEFAIMLLVSGDEATLAELDKELPQIESQFDNMVFTSSYTQTNDKKQPVVNYRVDVLALDHKGIVHNLARFVSERNINIQDLNTSSYAAPHTGSRMFAVNMILNIPAATVINQLRDAFIQHCDNLNLDASFEVDRK